MPYFPKDAVVKRLLAENKAIATITEEDITHILDDNVYDREDSPTSNEQWLIVPTTINEQNSHLLSALLSTGLRHWQVSLKRNNFLVLRHWETGSISVKKPSRFKRHKKQQITPLSAQGEAPNEFNASSWMHSLKKIDIIYNFSDVLTAGNYTITQVYYDEKTSSEHFTYSTESNETLTFPELADVDINAQSVELKFKQSNNKLSSWKLNLIAFKLDEKPIITPFKVDLTKNEQNFTLELPIKNGEWPQGLYQIYIDTGNSLKGPFKLNL